MNNSKIDTIEIQSKVLGKAMAMMLTLRRGCLRFILCTGVVATSLLFMLWIYKPLQTE